MSKNGAPIDLRIRSSFKAKRIVPIIKNNNRICVEGRDIASKILSKNPRYDLAFYFSHMYCSCLRGQARASAHQLHARKCNWVACEVRRV